MLRTYRRLETIGLVVLTTIIAVTCTAAASDRGRAASDLVSQSSYQGFMNNSLYTHNGNNRGRTSSQHDLARNNIKALFESYGLPTVYETFTYSGSTQENVVATKLGTVHPEQIYIVGSHYDSVNNPGADDNASGTALVLEAARILSAYSSDCTIRFIAFDAEEAGLIGSTRYATLHASEDIRGMISADMVAYDPGAGAAKLFGHTAACPIKISLGEAITEYGGLDYGIRGGLDASDHAPFENIGKQACLLIEGSHATNPNYHTAQDSYDTPGYLNFPYAVKMTRSVVGWLTDHAGVNVPVNTLNFTFPDGLADAIDPLGGTRVRVGVSGVGSTVPQAGTGVLYYDAGLGWHNVPMEVVSANVYDAVFPTAVCGEAFSYYFSAQAVGGQAFTDPRDAASDPYAAIPGYGPYVVFADDFETDQGWIIGATDDHATAGIWERAAPEQTGAQPGEDHTPGSGTLCYVTDHRAGAIDLTYDVDDGKTTLKSPVFDLSGYDVIRMSYWRWYFYEQPVSTFPESFVVDISADGGQTWVNVETVGPAGAGTAGGWYHHQFYVGDFVPLTDQVQLRFVVKDGTLDCLVEAALDDFLIERLICMTPTLAGDMNCDGLVNGQDIDGFVYVLFGAAPYTQYYAWSGGGCNHLNADMNSDGVVNGQDIDAFTAVLFGG